MANYDIPTTPVYDANIRKLEDSDPASASTVFNPLIQQLVTNTHAVKKQSDGLSNDVSNIEDELEQCVKLDENGKIPGSVIGPTGIPPQIVVTAIAGSTVTCSHGSTTLTAVSTGKTTFDLDSYGTWTVTAVQNGKTTSVNIVVDTVKQYTLTFEFSATLANNTWAQIAEASETGRAKDLWAVGDEINISVSGETLTLVIMGFDHDDLAGGGKAGITFGLKNLMAATRQMNSTNTNSGGFTGSALYNWLQNTLFDALPADLKSVIKTVNKKTSAGNQSTTINTDTMKLFTFSEVEVFGAQTYSVAGEGSQYPYFATAATRVKKLANGTGSASTWWGRSPNSSSSTHFCTVHSSGTASANNASNSCGVCFGFCV